MNKKIKLSLRSLSLFLVVSFLFEQISFGVEEIKTFNPISRPSGFALGFDLPESIASIEDSYQAPNSSKTIYLIQDAHTNTSGQINLAKTLDLLVKNQSINHVFIEAGFENESLFFLKQYGTKEKRKKLAEQFLKRGNLQGEEYLNIVSDKDFVLWGVEDLNLYNQALENYKQVIKQRTKFGDYLNRIEQTTKIIKSRIYNPLLLSLDESFIQYQKGNLSITQYLKKLTTAQDLKDHPHLKNLKKLQKLEQILESQKKHYPKLSLVNQYKRLSAKIEATQILKELEALESKAFNSLMTTDDEKTLFQISKVVDYLKKLLNLTITPEEYSDYVQIKRDFGIQQITGFLNKKIMDLKSYYENALFLKDGFEDTLKASEDFYNLTIKRDQAFIQNTLFKIDQEKEIKAILITGGYHTSNLKKLLKEQNISYVVLAPVIAHETNQKRYENLLIGTQSYLSPSPTKVHLNASSAVTMADILTLHRASGIFDNPRYGYEGKVAESFGEGSALSGPLATGARMAFQKSLFGEETPEEDFLKKEGITSIDLKIEGKGYKLFGIGHSNRTQEQLIELLKKAGIKTVIDIRTRPYSQWFPHFNQKKLKETLPKENITYFYQGDTLGGKHKGYDDNFKQYIKDNPNNKFTQGILTLLKNIQKQSSPVAILCSEKKLEQCHRKEILNYLKNLNPDKFLEGNQGARLVQIEQNETAFDQISSLFSNKNIFKIKTVDITNILSEAGLRNGMLPKNFPDPSGRPQLKPFYMNIGTKLQKVVLTIFKDKGRVTHVEFEGISERKRSKMSSWIWNQKKYEFKHKKRPLVSDIQFLYSEENLSEVQTIEITNLFSDKQLMRGFLPKFPKPDGNFFSQIWLQIGRNLERVNLTVFKQRGKVAYIEFEGLTKNGKSKKRMLIWNKKEGKFEEKINLEKKDYKKNEGNGWTNKKSIPLIKKIQSLYSGDNFFETRTMDITNLFSEKQLKRGTLPKFPKPNGEFLTKLWLKIGKNLKKINLTVFKNHGEVTHIEFEGLAENRKSKIRTLIWDKEEGSFEEKNQLEMKAAINNKEARSKGLIAYIESLYSEDNLFEARIVDVTDLFRKKMSPTWILPRFPEPGGGYWMPYSNLKIGEDLKKVILTIQKQNGKVKFVQFKGISKQGKIKTSTFEWNEKEHRFKSLKNTLKSESKISYDQAESLYKKYAVYDLATVLFSHPSEFHQILSVLLSKEGEELDDQTLAKINKAFILNLKERGYETPSNLKPGNGYDYLKALMGLKDKIKNLNAYEGLIFIRAFIRMEFQNLAKDFEGSIQKIKDTLKEVQDETLFKELMNYVEDQFNKALHFHQGHIKTTLKPHQRVGSYFLRHSDQYWEQGIFGFLLEDDTRLGKTIQTYHAIEPSWKALAVVPANIIDEWQEQFKEHVDRPLEDLIVIRGSPEKKKKLIEETRYKKGIILLITMEDLRLKEDEDLESLSEGLDVVVIDEAQSVQNYQGTDHYANSLQAEVIHKLKTKRRWLLSATPYLSDPSQLFSLFHLLHKNPDTGKISDPLFESKQGFVKNLSTTHQQMHWLYALKAKMALRRSKEEMGDMYSKKREIDPKEEGEYELTSEQSSLVLSIIKNLEDYLKVYNPKVSPEDQYPKKSIGPLLKLYFLNLALTDPLTLKENISTHFYTSMDEMVLSRLAKGQKGILFAENTALIDKIQDYYQKQGIKIARIDGTMKGAEQSKQRHLFQKDPDTPLIVMNLKAGVGLNLSKADFVLYTQHPKLYPTYHQTSARALGLTVGAQKTVDVLFMIAKYPKAFQDSLKDTPDFDHVKATASEIFHNIMMTTQRQDFQIVQEGLPADEEFKEDKAVRRLLRSISGFLTDPSFKAPKKHLKKLEQADLLYPVYSLIKSNEEGLESFFKLLDLFSKTDISKETLRNLSEVILKHKNVFSPQDLRYLAALDQIPNKYHKDSLVNLLPELLETIYLKDQTIHDIIQRGPPLFRDLLEDQIYLLIPLLSLSHPWDKHPGQEVLLDLFSQIEDNGYSEFEKKKLLNELTYSLVGLIDLKNPGLLLNFLQAFKETLLSEDMPHAHIQSFFESLSVLKGSNPEALNRTLSLREGFESLENQIKQNIEGSLIDLFGLPKDTDTYQKLLSLSKTWGSLNAPLKLMTKLKTGNGLYTEHAELFKKVFKHILNGTYPDWRNKQSLDLTSHEITYKEDDPYFWEVFTKEEDIDLGDIEVSSKQFKNQRQEKLSLILERFKSPEALKDAFGPLSAPILNDLQNPPDFKELLKTKGLQKQALENKTEDLKKFEEVKEELHSLHLRKNIGEFIQALEAQDLKIVQRLLSPILKEIPDNQDVLDSSPLKVLLEELKTHLNQKDKSRTFKDVTVQITSDPHLLMLRGSLHPELKNCFNLDAKPKQIAALLDDLSSRNKMLAIVKTEDKIASITMVKVRKTENNNPILLVERSLYRFGYNFENEIAQVLQQTKLEQIKDALIATEIHRQPKEGEEMVTLYTTSTRAPEEYHEAVFGLRPRSNNTYFQAKVWKGEGARLAEKEVLQIFAQEEKSDILQSLEVFTTLSEGEGDLAMIFSQLSTPAIFTLRSNLKENGRIERVLFHQNRPLVTILDLFQAKALLNKTLSKENQISLRLKGEASLVRIAMKNLGSRLSNASKLEGAVELDLEHLKAWAQTKQKGFFKEVLPFCLDLIKSGRGTYYLSHLGSLTKEEQKVVWTHTDSLENVTFTKPEDMAVVKIHFTNIHKPSKPVLSKNELALSINEDGFANLFSFWIAEEIADVYTRNLSSKKTIPAQEDANYSKLLEDLQKNILQIITDYSSVPARPSAKTLDEHLRGQLSDPRLILKSLIAILEDAIETTRLVRDSVDVRA